MVHYHMVFCLDTITWILYTWIHASWIEFNNCPTRCDLFRLFIQTYQYNGTLITEQNRGIQNPLFQLAIDTGLTSQLFHNKWIPTVRYTWIGSNSTARADGSRSRYVKTILLISVVLFPKYFIITKWDIHMIVLTDFVYCIFR